MTTLYMVKIGATLTGRIIEQHDVFFGVAENIADLTPAINAYWKEAENKWHYDAYRTVTKVGNYKVTWVDETETNMATEDSTDVLKLYFINLGGYLPNHFEEYHHKLLIVAKNQADAIRQAKKSEFYKHYSYTDDSTKSQPTSHIDDKLLVDVDDIYDVNTLLAKGRLLIHEIAEDKTIADDKQVIGYGKPKKPTVAAK